MIPLSTCIFKIYFSAAINHHFQWVFPFPRFLFFFFFHLFDFMSQLPLTFINIPREISWGKKGLTQFQGFTSRRAPLLWGHEKVETHNRWVRQSGATHLPADTKDRRREERRRGQGKDWGQDRYKLISQWPASSNKPLMSDDPIRSGHINTLAVAEVNTLTSLQNLYYILFA